MKIKRSAILCHPSLSRGGSTLSRTTRHLGRGSAVAKNIIYAIMRHCKKVNFSPQGACENVFPGLGCGFRRVWCHPVVYICNVTVWQPFVASYFSTLVN